MTNFREITSSLKTQIQNDVQNELQHSYSKTSARNDPKGRHEPDFIADVVVDAIPMIANNWQVRLSSHGIDVSLAAAFCHQSPKVTYTHNGAPIHKKPELGDLLLVHIHHPKRGRIARRSLLLQAKKATGVPHTVSPSDQHQHILYSSWPDFSYVSPKELSTLFRQVTPKAPHDGAKYLLIETSTRTFSTHQVQTQLQHGRSLAEEITGILCLKAGRPFSNYSINLSDWNAVVWDVLRMSFSDKITFTRSHAGYNKHTRMAGQTTAFENALFCLGPQLNFSQENHHVSNILNGFGGQKVLLSSAGSGHGNDPIQAEHAESNGILTILIETKDTGSSQESYSNQSD